MRLGAKRALTVALLCTFGGTAWSCSNSNPAVEPPKASLAGDLDPTCGRAGDMIRIRTDYSGDRALSPEDTSTTCSVELGGSYKAEISRAKGDHSFKLPAIPDGTYGASAKCMFGYEQTASFDLGTFTVPCPSDAGPDAADVGDTGTGDTADTADTASTVALSGGGCDVIARAGRGGFFECRVFKDSSVDAIMKAREDARKTPAVGECAEPKYPPAFPTTGNVSLGDLDLISGGTTLTTVKPSSSFNYYSIAMTFGVPSVVDFSWSGSADVPKNTIPGAFAVPSTPTTSLKLDGTDAIGAGDTWTFDASDADDLTLRFAFSAPPGSPSSLVCRVPTKGSFTLKPADQAKLGTTGTMNVQAFKHSTPVMKFADKDRRIAIDVTVDARFVAPAYKTK